MLIIRRVVGKSMLPSLRPGQIVVCWRWFTGLRPGHVVVVRHDGLEKIKRIRDIKKQGVFVLGDNPGGSTDSRDFGVVPHKDVVAKVIWPRL